jgi:hypothetical protein
VSFVGSNGSRPGPDDEVVCIACGATVRRAEAREYDKHGDRWDRADKDFEYLCKPCDKERCHRPRDGLEETLVAANAGETDRDRFLGALLDQMEDDADATTGR